MLAFRPVPVFATAQPQPQRPKPNKSAKISKQLNKAIEHANLICTNYEDTKECGVAWDQVEELSAALNDALMAAPKEEEVWFDDISKREYDV
jgi:hypothetical protein